MKGYTGSYKRFAIKAAKELGYDKNIIERIKATDDEDKISQIMAQARINGGKST